MIRGRLRKRFALRSRALQLSVLSATVLTLANCSFRRPGQETPAPRPAESVVVDKRKGFFGSFRNETVQIQPEVRNGRGAVIQAARYRTARVFRPKTFLCGWASEAEAGGAYESFYEHAVEAVTHCNVEFEITEKELIARQVNPSFPDDRARWDIALKIGIESHFYYEPKKDSAGRDTSEMIENSARSVFDARPFMRLKLYDMEIVKLGYALSGLSSKPMLVEDVEWDEANGFLGFSATVNTTHTDFWSCVYGPEYCVGGNSQAKFRVNFKAFESNPQFKKTPFHDSNYRYMNALHVMGRRVDGMQQDNYAAHWDLAKNPKVYLYQVPDEYKGLMETIVGEWNAALRKAGALRADQPGFTIADEEPRHAFDLRYPTIIWVNDMRISYRAPLGVGMAHADVRTGEIMWGSITLYGGLIDQYIKSYLPIESGASGADAMGAAAIASSAFSDVNAGPLGLPPAMDAATGLAMRASLPGAFSGMPGVASAEQVRDALARTQIDAQARNQSAAAISPRQIAERLLDDGQLTPEIAQGMAAELGRIASQRRIDVMQALTARQPRERLMTPINSLLADGGTPMGGARSRQFTPAESVQDRAARRALDLAQRIHFGNVFDTDRTLGDVAAGWAAATRGLNSAGFDQTVRTVIKELVSHEYGHFLGLGHQFKENILPEEGTVPQMYLAGWRDTASGEMRPGLKELATAEAGWTNASSVMGYRDPRTEIANREELVKPGPQDELTLQYIYTQRYSTYKAGDPDFTPVEVGPDGQIPASLKDIMPDGYRVAYFPQCNDYEASLNMDPYCNRFDRGANATDIAKNYMGSLKDNLVQDLVSFSDSRGGNPWGAYGRLWARSYATMSRVRLFYDYMRRENAFRTLLDEIRSDEDMLYDFSRACTTDATDVKPRLAEIMAQNPKFKELCAVNAYAMGEYRKLLSLNAVDYTKMDWDNRYVPGGMRGGEATPDYSRVRGSWTELSGLPLKYAAMHAMQTSRPWAQLGYWEYAIPGYDSPDTRALYSWLYPREYTEAISSTVSANLKFVGVDATDRTLMGQAVLGLGYYSWIGRMPSDSGLFPPRYVDRVRGQTRFDLSIVAVMIRGEKKDGPTSETRVDRFSGEVYDFQENEKQPLSEAYLLPDGQVVVRAPNMFLYPITTFKLFSDRAGYVFAYKLSYFRDPDDRFAEISVKSQLKAKHDSVLNACIMGPKGRLNGLSQFFNKTEPAFEGFEMSNGLYDDPEEKGTRFLRSIRAQFANYYRAEKFKNRCPSRDAACYPRRETCDEAIRGLGLIISSAAVLNGYWLPEVNNYLQE